MFTKSAVVAEPVSAKPVPAASSTPIAPAVTTSAEESKTAESAADDRS